MRKLLGAAILAVVSPLAGSAELRDARSVLQQIEGTSAEVAGKSGPAQLLADIQQFREQYRQLAPRVAAERWFEHLDRVRALPGSNPLDPNSFDAEVMQAVGLRSVLASIPSPDAWPEMHAIAVERMKKAKQPDVDLLSIQFLTEALNNDAAALTTSLGRTEAALTQLAPSERKHKTSLLLGARLNVASTYGSQADVMAAYEALLDAVDSGNSDGFLAMPDVVGMLGKERATLLLRRAVTSPATVVVNSGVETRQLARQIALDNIAAMRIPQWQLVDAVEAAPLYEAINEKFGKHADSEAMEDYTSGPASDEANVYYLLSSIIQKQQQKAEAALARIARKEGYLHIPPFAVKALREAGQSEALVEFLQAALSKQPELQAWDVYIEQSSYVGRSQQALELIRQLQKRSDVPAHLRKELERREVDALLANNRIDEAIASLRRRIATPPSEQSDEADRYVASATRLAQIGLLLERRALVNEGLVAARAGLKAPRGREGYERDRQVTHLYGAYRRVGDASGAQNLALSQLANRSSQADQTEQFGIAAPDMSKRKALVELVGIYTAANRPQDALTLLRDAKQWGARDLGDLIDEKDSLGVPVGYSAARALVATGERDAALRVLRELLDRLPGYDGAYQLLLELTSNTAIAELDKLYLSDQFEERPLIWKARAQLNAGQLQEAEQTIRRAIAIDPSDGEQPANDRLRAYAVLADIVEAKGQKKDAVTYRQALEAIRISERADLFHAAGLYDRAFTMYRDSLARFSDAYCIQSRLAIQLSRQGRHQEAVAHYRRAYELMPDSFGRVESHCFGCESIFNDPKAQSIAEQVFAQALERDRQKPQAHYLLGYLRKEQGRYAEALQSFRAAVDLDDSYLNAWKQLNELGKLTYIDAAEREIFQQKLVQLDPRQRHVQYELDSVRDISQMWRELERQRVPMTDNNEVVLLLTGNARKLDDALASLPPELRAQAELYATYTDRDRILAAASDPRRFVLGHAMTKYVAEMMGVGEAYY
jgi:tetratricopeptide (TPR) repeat protein